jgi:DNA-directed RNA polymerase subunit RPC12/RpoP
MVTKKERAAEIDLSDEMRTDYCCADCQNVFSISVTDDEMNTAMESTHSEKCPRCGQKVGWGHMTCRECGEEFIVELLHWHVHCTLGGDKCPKCGTEYVSACVC